MFALVRRVAELECLHWRAFIGDSLRISNATRIDWVAFRHCRRKISCHIQTVELYSEIEPLNAISREKNAP